MYLPITFDSQDRKYRASPRVMGPIDFNELLKEYIENEQTKGEIIVQNDALMLKLIEEHFVNLDKSNISVHTKIFEAVYFCISCMHQRDNTKLGEDLQFYLEWFIMYWAYRYSGTGVPFLIDETSFQWAYVDNDFKDGNFSFVLNKKFPNYKQYLEDISKHFDFTVFFNKERVCFCPWFDINMRELMKEAYDKEGFHEFVDKIDNEIITNFEDLQELYNTFIAAPAGATADAPADAPAAAPAATPAAASAVEPAATSDVPVPPPQVQVLPQAGKG